MNRATEHEHDASQLAGCGKVPLARGRSQGSYRTANDEASPLEFWVARGRSHRERTQHQVAKMPVEQVIGEFHEPEMAAHAPRQTAALEELRDDHLGGVQTDHRDAMPAERRGGVFRIDYRNI